MKQRIVVTGMGAVSPYGVGVQTLMQGVYSQKKTVKRMDGWDGIEGLTSYVAATVPDLDPRQLPRKIRRTMGPMAIMATLAAFEAVKKAGLSKDVIESGRIGAVVGSTTGSPHAYLDFYKEYMPDYDLSGIKSGNFFQLMSHTCVSNIALALGIKGSTWATCSACASSSQAIGLGLILIQSGRQDIVLCGGADEVHPTVTAVFNGVKAASSSFNDQPEMTPRPFDKQRDGMVCGEGAGIIVLESLESALLRGADIYGEIMGFASITDGRHIADPDFCVMSQCMTLALKDAGINPSDIDYINAHATATEKGDIAEARAIYDIFNNSIPVSSLKGHIGHTLGASGVIETIACFNMLRDNRGIATMNLSEPGDGCEQIFHLMHDRDMVINKILKNNFAFGGINTSLVIGDYIK